MPHGRALSSVRLVCFAIVLYSRLAYHAMPCHAMPMSLFCSFKASHARRLIRLEYYGIQVPSSVGPETIRDASGGSHSYSAPDSDYIDGIPMESDALLYDTGFFWHANKTIAGGEDVAISSGPLLSRDISPALCSWRSLPPNVYKNSRVSQRPRLRN